MISTKEQEEKWAEEIKYFAARFVWTRRHQKTPKNLTWEQWWERRFQDSFREYTEKLMDKKTK